MTLADLVSVAGAVTPVAAVGVRAAANAIGRRSVLGFSGPRVHVVLTSSGRKEARAQGIARPTTGIGSVVGLGAVAQGLGRHYRRLLVDVDLSAQVDGRLNGDLVTLGGPRRNVVTALILNRILDARTDRPIVSFDDITNSLTVGAFVVTDHRLGTLTDGSVGDVAVVVRAPNPYSGDGGRVVVCCGFSSHGTGGAARWLFEDALDRQTRLWRRRGHAAVLPHVENDRADVVVLEVQIVDGRAVAERVLHHERFPVPKAAR